MSIFDINADIRHARTLDSRFYTDARFFEESKDRIFARSWQFVGGAGDVRLGGEIKPITILENFLDEPAILVRDEMAKLHCLSNVCTHRGNILVENPCRESGLRCRYHGRRFRLNGEFVSMPEFETIADFPTAKDDLPEIPFAVWQDKFVFAAINPCAPFAEFAAEMTARVGWLDFEEMVFAPTLSRDYLVQAHWALYCENYLEGFHIPFVHQSLNSAIDYGSYTTDLFRFSSVQTAVSRGGENVFALPENSVDYGKQIAAYYFWIFPNLMFNFYPWGLSVNIVKPLKPDLTRVSFLTFVADEAKLEQGAGANLDRVEREDEAVVENVQKGIKSRFYDAGRYSPTRETGTHHFHRLISEFMK